MSTVPKCKKCEGRHWNFQPCESVKPPASPGGLAVWGKPLDQDKHFGPPVS